MHIIRGGLVIMGKVVWFEIPADDVAKTTSFYEKSFGWKIQEIDETFNIVHTSGNDETPKESGFINGGIAKKTKEFSRPHVIIECEDIDQTIANVLENGGTLLLDKQENVDFGLIFAIIEDIEGNSVGIIQNI